MTFRLWRCLFLAVTNSPGISYLDLKRQRRRGWKGWEQFLFWRRMESFFFCCQSFLLFLCLRMKCQMHLNNNKQLKGVKSSGSFASEGSNINDQQWGKRSMIMLWKVNVCEGKGVDQLSYILLYLNLKFALFVFFKHWWKMDC